MTLSELFTNAGQGTDTTISVNIVIGNIWPETHSEAAFSGTLRYGLSRSGTREQAQFSGLVGLDPVIPNNPRFLMAIILAPTGAAFVPGTNPYLAFLIPLAAACEPGAFAAETFTPNVTSTAASIGVTFDNNPVKNGPYVAFAIQRLGLAIHSATVSMWIECEG